ncbi:hypothetical protein CPB86DRAFT_873654 [Serendipita vermifera]|nr:hypothetical protein CPB86DRAFT_873654 [Serendipita vermifera]
MSLANEAVEERPEAAITESSPIKQGQRAVAGHNREEIAKYVVPQATEDLGVEEFWKLLKIDNHSREDFEQCIETVRVEGECYVQYLNRLSLLVHDTKFSNESNIIFVNCKNERFLHPTRTKCRPDFVALKRPPGGAMNPESLKELYDMTLEWSIFETTGEIRSEGQTEMSSQNQGVSYTHFLLQARPDYTQVLGIYVREDVFRLSISNACGVANLKELKWGDDSAIPILCAWVFRLYAPFTVPDITRNTTKDSISFDIQIGDTTYEGCRLSKTGTAFGRRTTIFEVPGSSLVIKFQYIETKRRFSELGIICHIHSKGSFPGVVRINAADSTPLQQVYVTTQVDTQISAIEESKEEDVRRIDAEDQAPRTTQPEAQETVPPQPGEEALASTEPRRQFNPIHQLEVPISAMPQQLREDPAATEPTAISSKSKDEPIIVKLYRPVEGQEGVTLERQRTRLVMEDGGIPIMNVATPRDVLIALYDVLEVTRFLWRKRRTLHRDISDGNVLVHNDDLSTIPEELKSELAEMCFATALLGDDGPGPNADRLETPLLLIDFDMAQNQEPETGKIVSDRTATPYFMARAVRSPEIRNGVHAFFPMPQLSAGAARYEQCVGQRLQKFQPNKHKFEVINHPISLKPFQHRLHYDAESVFWLLLWWAMQAKPLRDKLKNDVIRETDWDDFTAGVDADDRRGIFIDGKGISLGTCHPKYAPLETLLRSMSDQLKGYHEILDDSDIRKHDEYLHEAFQRLIFEFLSEHLKAGSKFLIQKKDFDRRPLGKVESMKQPPPVVHHAESSLPSSHVASTSKRVRKNEDDDEYQEGSRTGKKLKI